VNRDNALLLALVGLLAAGAFMAGEKIISRIRGIRNNNPGNIERTGTRWQGMSADQSGDDRFIVFTAPQWGIRAMARILKNYQLTGVDTIRKMISRYAPSHENPTNAYVANVAAAANLDPDRQLSADALQAYLPLIIKGMIRQELGVQPYDDATIAAGIALERNA